jgi:hypothetical protein
MIPANLFWQVVRVYRALEVDTCTERLPETPVVGIRLDSEVTTKYITYLLVLCLSDEGPSEHCANGPK